MLQVAERVYTTSDRSQWNAPPGPWDSEPDKIQWTDAATGLPCLAKRHPHLGSWCGYVGIAEGHPLFGKGYSECVSKGCAEQYCYEHTPESMLDVHGGITYADRCQDGPEAIAICHVPEPGQADHVWWFGFDCAHAGDLSPGYAFTFGLAVVSGGDVYRDLAYVRRQCAHLAQQLKLLSEHSGGLDNTDHLS